MAERFQPQSNEELKEAVRTYCCYHDRSRGPSGTWDTTLITNMSWLFSQMGDFNESIADWNTSSVTDMSGMFQNCSSFNQPLHTWDTSSVTNMKYMFWDCTSFYQPLGNWHAPFSVFDGCPDPEYCCNVFHDHYCVK